MNFTSEETQLLRWLRMLRRYILIILLLPLMGGGIGFYYAAKRPAQYTARATLYVVGNVGSLTMPINFPGLQMMPQFFQRGSTSGEYIETLLGSRWLAEKVIRKLHLDTNKDFLGGSEKTRPNVARLAIGLSENVEALVSGGLVEFNVLAPTENLAKDITNAYIADLNSILYHPGKQQLVFLEGQARMAKERLDLAEKNLAESQRRTGHAVAPEMLNSDMAAYSALLKNKITAEIDLGKAERELQTNENLVDEPKLRMRVESLKAELQGLRDKTGIAESRVMGQSSRFPDEDLQVGQRLREVKTEEALYLGVVNQYEMAKMSAEEKNGVFQVIDRPDVADLVPSGKMRFSIAGACAGLILAIFLALVLDQLRVAGETPRNGGENAARA